MGLSESSGDAQMTRQRLDQRELPARERGAGVDENRFAAPKLQRFRVRY